MVFVKFKNLFNSVKNYIINLKDIRTLRFLAWRMLMVPDNRDLNHWVKSCIQDNLNCKGAYPEIFIEIVHNLAEKK